MSSCTDALQNVCNIGNHIKRIKEPILCICKAAKTPIYYSCLHISHKHIAL